MHTWHIERVYNSKAVGILRVILFRLLPNIFTLFWSNEGTPHPGMVLAEQSVNHMGYFDPIMQINL